MSSARSISCAEVADRLGCSRSHVQRLVHDGVLPVVPHMGRRFLIPTWAVDQLVASAEFTHVRSGGVGSEGSPQTEGPEAAAAFAPPTLPRRGGVLVGVATECAAGAFPIEQEKSPRGPIPGGR